MWISPTQALVGGRCQKDSLSQLLHIVVGRHALSNTDARCNAWGML